MIIGILNLCLFLICNRLLYPRFPLLSSRQPEQSLICLYYVSLNLTSLCLFSLLSSPVMRNQLHSIRDWLFASILVKTYIAFQSQGNFTNVIISISIYLDSNICVSSYTIITLTLSFTVFKFVSLYNSFSFTELRIHILWFTFILQMSSYPK